MTATLTTPAERTAASETFYRSTGETIGTVTRWRWLAEPHAVDGGYGWSGGRLEINGVAYDAACEVNTPDDGSRVWLLVTLGRDDTRGRRTITVEIDPAGRPTCTCEHARLAGVMCKHAGAVKAAILAWSGGS